MTSLYAVTVLGHDRPGIIAAATDGLAGLGLNIEDSTMTLLRGHFAMMLLCSTEGASGPVGPRDIEQALAPLTADGDLDVAVRPVTDEPTPGTGGSSWVLTVHGGDRPGIVSAVVGEVATAGGNITDLTTRLAGDLYLLVAELDLPAGADAAAVEAAIKAAAHGVGVTATLRAAEADDL
ncbi:glycine cleavage system protein R [Nocardioides bizhenqiangii]|uniref:ACT domain-containing protein n=1 Tax=Nocardioides bizhenqiangii TaxID=3095076 RepID=A0ABZ0ZVZ0_9ACTN|nr:MULTISPECIES: ACT domain-containing protein [unclassified Nocardioides]MDZ5623604.1 ACT domain-containing protein [Nocardioides sp. HM23]WQQ27827.1 ACT domain-containing protein [Nocardioides sp. HM61]